MLGVNIHALFGMFLLARQRGQQRKIGGQRRPLFFDASFDEECLFISSVRHLNKYSHRDIPRSERGTFSGLSFNYSSVDRGISVRPDTWIYCDMQADSLGLRGFMHAGHYYIVYNFEHLHTRRREDIPMLQK